MRLIDADALPVKTDWYKQYVFYTAIEEAPTVDAVPVVRCKDCIHDNTTDCHLCWIENHTLQFINHDAEFFCGKGERRIRDE